MWQEIVVGIIVAICAAFLGRRWWKNLYGAKTGSVDCGCKCDDCGQSCCADTTRSPGEDPATLR